MDIKLNEDAVRAVVSGAIMAEMTQESKDALIKEAIQALILPEKDRYGHASGPTKLQVAFREAMGDIAYKVVKEVLENDPRVKAALHDLTLVALQRVITEGPVTQDISKSLSDILMNRIKDSR